MGSCSLCSAVSFYVLASMAAAAGLPETPADCARCDFKFRDVYAFGVWTNGVELSERIGEVAPGEKTKVSLAPSGPESPDPPRWRIEYSDLNGLRWQQRSDGVLSRLEDEDTEP